MISAIYIIRNKTNNNIYVGSATDFNHRKAQHLSDLKLNKHSNIILTRAYNKYGEQNFVFEILEVVNDKNELINKEQWWIDLLNPQYNILQKAGSSFGYRHTQECKIKMSEQRKGKKQSLETINKRIENQIGKTLSDKTKKKISDKHKKPIVQMDINNNIIKVWESGKEASKALNIIASHISSVCRNKRITAGGYKWQYAN